LWYLFVIKNLIIRVPTGLETIIITLSELGVKRYSLADTRLDRTIPAVGDHSSFEVEDSLK
ncbi:hypothetical protein, partial [Alteromonas australica]|uniref:hypothetical protein n=1 Tax=Alteromonas australica TaxID=589873 RepID=UPI0023570F8D